MASHNWEWSRKIKGTNKQYQEWKSRHHYKLTPQIINREWGYDELLSAYVSDDLH